MALGQTSGGSSKGRSKADYLSPDVAPDRAVINHIWNSINDLHDRYLEGQVSVDNLDDFSDWLKEDYGVNTEITDKNNFVFSQDGSDKIATGAFLSRHIGKIKGIEPPTSITGKYICEEFGTQFPRRSSLQNQQQPNSVARSRRAPQAAASQATPQSPPQAAASQASVPGNTQGFDEIVGDLSSDSEGDSGGDDSDFVQDDDFASDTRQVESQQGARLDSVNLDSSDMSGPSPFGEDGNSTGNPPGRQASQQPSSNNGSAPPQSNFGAPGQSVSEIVKPPPPQNNQRSGQQNRDLAGSAVSDAAGTFSGLAGGQMDGVTAVADAGEVMAVAAAATMLGLDAVRKVQQSRNQRDWERLLEVGDKIAATEERGAEIAGRIVKVEDTLAAQRDGQPQEQSQDTTADQADQNQPAEQQRNQEPSPSEVAAATQRKKQAKQINDMDEKVAAMGQPDPNSKRLRVPKIDGGAPIGKRLDALEAYLSKINQKLDSIENRLEVLEQEAGISSSAKEEGRDRPQDQVQGLAPGQDRKEVVEAAANGAPSGKRSSESRPNQRRDGVGSFVHNITGKRPEKSSSQQQA